ncbi:MAG: hypothetical protein HY096_03595 [Nitrospinae bacterium]|nr:hypothetical protein [Nitrospinota bacterium]MBI5748280.1 hypothetical protein [Nitrospinota bacterium]
MEIYNEAKLDRIEDKLTEVRKLSMGILLLLKEIWKDDLKKDVSEVIDIIEKAEDPFINSSLTDRFERFENCLDVIDKRMKGIFLLVEDMLKNKQKAWI